MKSLFYYLWVNKYNYIMEKTEKYKQIARVFDASDPKVKAYFEMTERIENFIESDGKSIPGGTMEFEEIAVYNMLQNDLYERALQIS